MQYAEQAIMDAGGSVKAMPGGTYKNHEKASFGVPADIRTENFQNISHK
jgi:hypothetical protein